MRKLVALGFLSAGMVYRESSFRNALLYALAPRITEKYYRK